MNDEEKKKIDEMIESTFSKSKTKEEAVEENSKETVVEKTVEVPGTSTNDLLEKELFTAIRQELSTNPLKYRGENGLNGSSKPAMIMGLIAIAVSLFFCLIMVLVLGRVNNSYIKKRNDSVAQVEAVRQQALTDIDGKVKAIMLGLDKKIAEATKEIEKSQVAKKFDSEELVEKKNSDQKSVEKSKSIGKPKSAMDKIREGLGK